ncbi:MAG TPA: phosphatidate cytidylyltransferase [Gemmatimonadales bacterium]|jgi:phosphatidate cytidylyltransferase|nr:phosphatidate cytidylyltransferase [Gemmatimonadales bacterium]
MDANLRRRIAVAAIGIPAAIVLIWAGGWPLTLLLVTLAFLGCRELFDLALLQQVAPLRETGIGLASLTPLLTYLALATPRAGEWLGSNIAFVAVALVILLLIETLGMRGPDARPLSAVAVTLFGVFYVGVLPSFLLVIRSSRGEYSWSGTALVLFPLVVTWVGDTAAMFGGRIFGGAKLAPTISPGKTRAGGIAGLLGSAIIGPIFALAIFPAAHIVIDPFAATAVALVIGVLGQVGDLAESLFKREAGVKDSSTLIPGHGGVLDRLDSLYFAIPAAAACYRILGLV